ncbi:MAG: glycoside hydrolase family 18 protein [Chitinophagaceae bacterium]
MKPAINKLHYRYICPVLYIICIFMLLYCNSFAQKSKTKKYVVTGYVGGFRGLVNTTLIDAQKLTHIIYAFVDCRDSMAVLTNLKTDSINFWNLNKLKLLNPDLKITISIGGWAWSNYFSDAVLTPTSRALFAKTSVDIIRKYYLDGVDVDWEYPGQRGEDNVFRPEDKENYTLMFKAIRQELDSLTAQTGKRYELTAAVGGAQSFIDHTEMAEIGKILDYVYLMTYDYSGPNETVGHHTNLYADDEKTPGSSADRSIKNYIAAGVPREKLGIGAAFYGKGWLTESKENNGLGQKKLKNERQTAGGYTVIKDSLVNNRGYSRYWDKKAKAPYLFNPETNVFITYDDEKSVSAKCKYVKKNKLAGIFFWEYFSDPKAYLLTAINKDLN